jgi:flagellar hook-basal body complex protein FliE
MAINPVGAISPQSIEQLYKDYKGESINQSNRIQFGQVLNNALETMNTHVNTTQETLENIISGKSDDLHQYIIESEKTSANLQLTLQVRNKVVDAYNEIMRMQV